MLVVVVPVAGAVNLVGAGLGGHGDGGASRHALFGVERGRRNVDVVDRLDRRVVERVVRQPDVDIDGAVDPRVVVVAVGAVDVGAQRALRGGAHRVLFDRRGGSGHEVDQALVVPEVDQREFDDGLGSELRTRVGTVRLQDRGRPGHGHLLAELADFQAEVDAGYVVDRDFHAGARERPESRRAGRDGIGAGRQVDRRVASLVVRYDLADGVGGHVGERHGGAGNDGAGGILDRADDRAVEDLSRGRLGKKACQQQKPGKDP